MRRPGIPGRIAEPLRRPAEFSVCPVGLELGPFKAESELQFRCHLVGVLALERKGAASACMVKVNGGCVAVKPGPRIHTANA